MRRQTHSQGLAARWQPVPLDVNPFQLPARFTLSVQNASGKALSDWDHVIIRQGSILIEQMSDDRPVFHCDYPIEAFTGLTFRIEAHGRRPESVAVSVNLHHDNPDCCIPLHVAFDMSDAGARWQSWGRVLGLPLLLPDDDGGWREAHERIGKLLLRRAFERDRGLWLNCRRSRAAASRSSVSPAIRDRIAACEIIARH